jgi:LuxR family transcriptional regulator, maltose regulon positive regulatory protein
MLASLARTHLAVAEWLSGRLPQAESAFAASAAQWRVTGKPFPAAWSSYQLGEVQRAQGRLGAALETYQQTLEITAASSRPALPAAGIAHVGMAEVAYQRGELEVALGHLTEGIALCRQLAYTQPLATGLAVLAWIRQAGNDHAGALEAIGEAERVVAAPGVASLLNPVPAQRARLLLAQRRPRGSHCLDEAARPWCRRSAELCQRAGASGAGEGAARPRSARAGG